MYYMIGYDRCSTCIKAMKHLKSKNIEYTFFDVKKNPPSKELLLGLIKRHEKVDAFWNTSGKVYRELDIKTKKQTMTNDEIADLLASEAMLIKRPIFYNDTILIIGYKKEAYDKL